MRSQRVPIPGPEAHGDLDAELSARLYNVMSSL